MVEMQPYALHNLWAFCQSPIFCSTYIFVAQTTYKYYEPLLNAAFFLLVSRQRAQVVVAKSLYYFYVLNSMDTDTLAQNAFTTIKEKKYK